MTNRFAGLPGLCLSLVFVLSLTVVPGALDAQDDTGSTTCWGTDAAGALALCQSAWDQSAANTTCSAATVTVAVGTTACTCNVEATCTKDDGVTTNSTSLSDPSPDNFNGAINCDGELKKWNC